MTHEKRTRLVLGVALVGAAALTSFAFDVPWRTWDGGGGRASGGPFTVTGTLGQHDAGGPLTGGAFSLNGGFWAAAATEPPGCEGDLDGDGDTDQADLGILLAAYGIDGGGDLDGDGDTDQADLGILLAAYGCTTDG